MLAALIAPARLLAQDPVAQVPGEAEPTPTTAEPPATPPVTAAPDPGGPQSAPAAPPAPTSDPPPQSSETAVTRAASSRAGQTVTIKDFSFGPASITVNAGDTVTWTNQGPTAHSATADDGSFDTGVFGAGASRSHTFDAPGTIAYHCTPHPFMTATVRVVASSSSGSSKGGSGSQPSSGSTAAPSEAAATASPTAAGTSTQLPSTGSDPLPLAVAGALLLAAGLLARRGSRPELWP